MGKFVTLILFFALSLMADPYTKENRIMDMQTMAQAMGKIQTGFFYNNNDLVQEGAGILSDTIRRVEPPLEEIEEKDAVTRYFNRKVEMSNKIVRKIRNKARIIMERFGEGDTFQALQAYSKITESCMNCHTELRSW